MKNYLLTGLVLFLSARIAAQVSATAQASVTIIKPIAIKTVADLDFGSIASGTSAGTVVLSAEGQRTLSGGVSLPVEEGTVSAAAFNVTGDANYTYSISLPSSVLLTSNGQTLSVTSFVSSPASGQLASGTQTLYVGATLHIQANQLPGRYFSESPFTVTVNYN